MPLTLLGICGRLFICAGISAFLTLIPLSFEEGTSTQAYFIMAMCAALVAVLSTLFFGRNPRRRLISVRLHNALVIAYLLLIILRSVYVVMPALDPSVPNLARGLPVIVARTYFLVLVMLTSIGVMYGDSVNWRRLYTNRDIFSTLVVSLSREGASALDLEVLDLISSISHVVLEYGRLSFSRRIGGGSHAVVYKGSYKEPRKPVKRVALKVYTPVEISAPVLKRWLREVSIATVLCHPNIVRCFGIAIAPPKLVVVMEYCPRTLLDHVSEKEHPFEELLGLMLDLASAIAHLHDKRLIHRDIKSRNVMVSGVSEHPGDRPSGRPVAKLIDFGESRRISREPMTFVGTPQYLAPEMLAHPITDTSGNVLSEYDQKVDIFSMSIVFWEILHRGQPMFPQHWSVSSVVTAIVGGFRPPINSALSVAHSALVDFIVQMWAERPENRPSASQVAEFLEDLQRITPT
jgi:tRNA A-37 threonylcarbamoyl transferase component Bud32